MPGHVDVHDVVEGARRVDAFGFVGAGDRTAGWGVTDCFIPDIVQGEGVVRWGEVEGGRGAEERDSNSYGEQ